MIFTWKLHSGHSNIFGILVLISLYCIPVIQVEIFLVLDIMNNFFIENWAFPVLCLLSESYFKPILTDFFYNFSKRRRVGTTIVLPGGGRSLGWLTWPQLASIRGGFPVLAVWENGSSSLKSLHWWGRTASLQLLHKWPP